MPIAKKGRVAYFLLILFLVVGAVCIPQAEALEPPAQDVVVLIDCSESMSPYLPAITGTMSRFVTDARFGDSFSFYQFSKNPVLFAQKKIEREGDIRRLKSQIGQLRPVGRYTNYATAIQRGMADINSSCNRQPANERILMLITDGRRGEGDTRGEKKAFLELFNEYGHLRGREDYSFYCFYIGFESEEDVRSYLRSVGAYVVYWPEDKEWLSKLTLIGIRIMEQTVFLGDIPDAPTQSIFSIAFYPRRPPKQISVLELNIEAEFAEKTLDRFFDVNPRRFVCQEEPWRQRFDLETRGFARGNYSGTFVFEPSEPQTTLLFPRRVDFSFSILEPLRVEVPRVLRFGPTNFRGEYEETKSIFIIPSRLAFPGSAAVVSVVPDIQLPEGLQLDVSKAMREKEIAIDITVSRSQTVSKKLAGEYEGTIRLVPKTPQWTLTSNEIPISVWVGQEGVDVGVIVLYIAAVAGCVLLLVVLLLASTRIRTAIKEYLAHRARPTGKLLVTADPSRGIARNINLDRISEKQGTKEILVGVGRGAHVELPHRSMMDKLYVFSGLKAKDDVHTIVEAAAGTDEVIINDRSRTGQIQLRHMDTVKLGAFEFRYEVPKTLRQVVVYFLSGEVLQGWPLSWNTEAEGFRFLNRETLPERKETYIRFYELKTVAFVRDLDGELTKRLLSLEVPRSGHRMKIVFADQEELTGYVLDWKDPGDKFYFFPDSMGDNILFLLIERHTVKEMVVLKEDRRGAERAQRELARVLEQMERDMVT